MAVHFMIDGYNVINAWNELKQMSENDLDGARKKLIDILSDYQGFKKCKVTIVFDSHLVKGAMRKTENINGVDIVFTAEGETADSYIEKYVYENAHDENIVVVTSDYLEQLMILGSGATRMPPRQFKSEIEKTKKEINNVINNYSKHRLEDHLDEKIIEILKKLRDE